jgi:RAB protein geranylgeranyltransferase component A
MGLFEKRRAKKFFEFLQGWKDDDPTTHQGEFSFSISISMLNSSAQVSTLTRTV